MLGGPNGGWTNGLVILVKDAHSSTNLGDIVINVGCDRKSVVKASLVLSDHFYQIQL